MKRRIQIAVFGSGLGHAARMSLVAEELVNQGDTVFFSSFDHAVDYIRDLGFHCERVPSLDVKWDAEGVSLKNTVRELPILSSKFVQQVRKENQIMKRLHPDIVVSDTRLSAVAAAYIRKIPSITVTNQIRILLPPKFHKRTLNKVEDTVAELLGLLWSRSQIIVVPDIPSPYTISEANTGRIRSTYGKVKYVGFMSPTSRFITEQLAKVSKELELNTKKRIVFAQVSGPPNTKGKLIDFIRKAANILSDRFNFVISKGEVGGDKKPSKIKGGWIYEWCPVKDEMFSLADILVVRGGHASISQAILYGKPIITIPILDHSEQIANATRVKEIGFGILLNPETISAKKISSAIIKLNDDISIKKKMIELNMIAQNLNGTNNTVNIINSLI